MDLKEIINKIDSLKKELDSLKPIKQEYQDAIWKKLRLDWNFHSNNLEGNSLNYGETKALLEGDITIGFGKKLREYNEIKGHDFAITIIQDLIKENNPLTEIIIRNLHKTIIPDEYKLPAITSDGQSTSRLIERGKYKSQPNSVETKEGKIFKFAEPIETPAKMESLMKWFLENETNKALHPVILATRFHYEFVLIHPFDDGNGRMARLLLNYTLMKFGYPPVIVRTEEKQSYFDVLEQADGGNIDAFITYIGLLLCNSLELYINGAKGNTIEESDDIDKEIAILQSKLNEVGEEEKIIGKTVENLKRVCEHSLFPLFDLFDGKLSKLKKLFKRSIADCSIGTYSVEWETDKVSSFITTKYNEIDKIQNINITYRLTQFKTFGFSQVRSDIALQISFQRYVYFVICSGVRFEKKYNEFILQSEADKMVMESIKQAIKKIDTDVEKMKNQSKK